MGHIVVPGAEALLDQEIKVLDHGFVRLVDYMGGDARIVQTARVSYGAGTRTLREDAALIDYLLRHQHTSPFEHVIFEFHCKMPIFVARQWIRHRTARLNEISGRYSVMQDEFYLPPEDQIKRQSADNKQGRDGSDVPPEMRQKVLELLKRDQGTAYASYEDLLGDGIARELARINLPLSTYTQWYWQMDLHNLFHFIALRADSHAQWEIREYAQALAGIVKAACPLAFDSFERHVMKGRRFSEDELDALRSMLKGGGNPLSGRRLKEFEEKLFGKSAPPEPPPASPVPQKEEPAPTPDKPSDAAQTPANAAVEKADAAPVIAPPDKAAGRLTNGWRVEISRDEINALPLRAYGGPVHLVRDDKTMREALRKLRKEKLLGFDTETRPSFSKGESYPPALLQLAAAECVYLFQLRPLHDRKDLFTLLADPGVRKAGVALDHDVRKLQELSPFVPAGFVDLATVTSKAGIRNNGLRGLAAIILGFRISKNAQRSNWGRDSLSPMQIAYAATDAWVSREIALELEKHGLIG